MSMKKNTIAHKVDQGMFAIASGYTSKTNPEPEKTLGGPFSKQIMDLYQVLKIVKEKTINAQFASIFSLKISRM